MSDPGRRSQLRDQLVHDRTAGPSSRVRARPRPPRLGDDVALGVEGDAIRLRSSTIHRDDMARGGVLTSPMRGVSVLGEEQVGELLRPVVLADQRMREHGAQHPVAAAVHRGIQRQPLVGGDWPIRPARSSGSGSIGSACTPSAETCADTSMVWSSAGTAGRRRCGGSHLHVAAVSEQRGDQVDRRLGVERTATLLQSSGLVFTVGSAYRPSSVSSTSMTASARGREPSCSVSTWSCA